jgi:hypothetical protein
VASYEFQNVSQFSLVTGVSCVGSLASVGDGVGKEVGMSVGLVVGALVGLVVGCCVGTSEGLRVGSKVGSFDGWGVATGWKGGPTDGLAAMNAAAGMTAGSTNWNREEQSDRNTSCKSLIAKHRPLATCRMEPSSCRTKWSLSRQEARVINVSAVFRLVESDGTAAHIWLSTWTSRPPC